MPQISFDVLHQLCLGGEELDRLSVFVGFSCAQLVLTRRNEPECIVNEGVITLCLNERDKLIETFKGEILVIDLCAIDELKVVEEDEVLLLGKRSLQNEASICNFDANQVLLTGEDDELPYLYL